MANTSAARINPHLTSAPQWLLHNANKKPYYADGTPRRGELDSAEDIAHLVSFEVACERADETGYGLGFAVYGGFQFIDLDHCCDTISATISDWARPVYEAALRIGAYIEISMSGTGFHVIGYGQTLPVRKRGHGEVYCAKRYCAMGTPVQTGKKQLPDLTILSDMLTMIDEQFEPARPTLRLVEKTPPLTWTDDRTRVARWLEALDPDMAYPDWITVGMAIHAGSNGHSEGLDLWERWSRTAARENAYTPGATAKFWKGFKAGGGIGLGTLAHMADDLVSSPVTAEDKPWHPGETGEDLLAADLPPIPWIVDGMLAAGLPLLLAAPPKAGKSYLVLQMGVCVSIGRPFLGRETTKTKVVYFNLEEDRRIVKKRLVPVWAAHAQKGDKLDNFYLQYVIEAGEHALSKIEDFLQRGWGLVIIDIFARIRDEMGEAEKVGLYKRDYNALAKIADLNAKYPDSQIVLVHHTNKGQDHEHWTGRISGSTGLAGAAGTLMALRSFDLRRTDEESKDEVRKHRALHWVGKLMGDQEEMIVQMDNGGGWTVSDRTEDEVLQTSKQRMVEKLLEEAGDWLTGPELVALLEDNEKPTAAQKAKWRQIFARMVKRGEIESDGQGKGTRGYRLPQ